MPWFCGSAKSKRVLYTTSMMTMRLLAASMVLDRGIDNFSEESYCAAGWLHEPSNRAH